MNKLRGLTASVALSALCAVAIADPSQDPAGIRVVGQAVDGTLVLDGASSGLTAWASAGFAMGSEKVEGSAPTLLVIGHVESWDPQSGVVTVSGQRTSLADEAVIIDAPRDIDGALTRDNLIWYLHSGSYVAVVGDSYGGGEGLATHIIRLDNEAKPGTVPIYIRGSVDYIDEAQGIAYLGNMALDLSVAPSNAALYTGDMVEVLAYQADSATVVATQYASLEGSVTASSKLTGITGSGLKGINGSGLKGITGSGLKGINGSGLKGITGSGLKGITGSGLKGITGSGLKGINGSGLKGITGSGLKGINGSGLKGTAGDSAS